MKRLLAYKEAFYVVGVGISSCWFRWNNEKSFFHEVEGKGNNWTESFMMGSFWPVTIPTILLENNQKIDFFWW